MQSAAEAPRVTGVPVAAAILAGMVAMSVLNVLPVLVGVMADRMGLDSRQAGLIASADVSGLTLGSLLCSLLRGRSMRLIGISGLALLALCNAVTMFVHGFELLAVVRFVAGFGGGFALAICYAVLGAGDQARDFAIFNVGQIAIGWLGTLFAPSLLAFGWQGVFAALAALAAAAALAGVFLPHHVPHASQLAGIKSVRWPAGAFISAATVASVLLYFTGQGGVWAYLDRMGAVRSFSTETITQALSWGMFAGMAASVIATWLDVRRGMVLPLVIGFAITTVGLVELWFLSSTAAYLAASVVFIFGWNLLVPYQFAAVAKVDGDGTLAMLASTATLAGFALGPAIDSPFADHNDFASIRVIALALNFLSVGLLIPALRYRSVPAGTAPAVLVPVD